MLAEYPLVTGRQSATDIPSFVAMVFQSREEAQGQFHASGIVLSAHGVYADEPAVELLAEPMAQFGLYDPMAQRTVVAAALLPWIETKEHLSSGFLAQSHFHAGVRRSGCPIKHVGFEGYFLCAGTRSGEDGHGQCHRSARKQVSRYQRNFVSLHFILCLFCVLCCQLIIE